jgi:hypothetical protein
MLRYIENIAINVAAAKHARERAWAWYHMGYLRYMSLKRGETTAHRQKAGPQRSSARGRNRVCLQEVRQSQTRAALSVSALVHSFRDIHLCLFTVSWMDL